MLNHSSRLERLPAQSTGRTKHLAGVKVPVDIRLNREATRHLHTDLLHVMAIRHVSFRAVQHIVADVSGGTLVPRNHPSVSRQGNHCQTGHQGQRPLTGCHGCYSYPL